MNYDYKKNFSHIIFKLFIIGGEKITFFTMKILCYFFLAKRVL